MAALWLPFGPLGPATAAAAGNCKLALESGQAAPGSGSPETVIDFTVIVSYKAACSPPGSVRVTVAGLASPTLALTPGASSTATGTTTATYTGQRTVGAVGSWPYEFAARVTAGDPWVVLPGSSPAALTISVPPTAPPTPKPTAKPKPTPKPTAKPKPTPKPTAKPTKASPTATPKPNPTRAPATTTDPKETPGASAPPGSVEPTLAPPSEPPPSGPDATRRPRTAAVVPPGGPLPPRGPGISPPTSPLPGGTSPFDIALVLLVWVACATAGSLLFAFALARRTGQREDELPFSFAMAAAAAPSAVVDGDSEGVVGVPEVADENADPEALIPRWRRPSLQAARQSHWVEEGAARVPQRFTAGAMSGDRRIVAYRLVFVSDRPSDEDAVEVGRLDRGDEVEFLRFENGFALMRAPDGLQGWVDASTLEEPPTA